MRDPDSDAFRIITKKLSDEQITAEDGSGGQSIVTAFRTQLGPKNMQETARLVLRLLKLNDIRRLSGESMKVDYAFQCLVEKSRDGAARGMRRHPD